MKIIELPAFGLEHLRLAEMPDPQAGPGELLVRFGAASINFRDVQICTGDFAPNEKLPLIPCSDGAGDIVAVGEGISDLAVGDRVCPLFFPEWQQGEALGRERAISSGLEAPGTLREYGIYQPRQVIKLPSYLSAEEAACLPCAGLTAWTCISTLAGIGPGDWVLAEGTGGVSILALQFAKALGAKVIVTSGSDAKLERARALGADHVINYRQQPDWGVHAHKITGGRGVDCVVEIGGEGTLPQAVAALRRGGHIGIVGYLAGIGLGLSVVHLIERNAHLHGVSVGNREGFAAMLECMATHEIRPVIDKVYPFEQAPAALTDLGRGKHFGKLVVAI